jgi:putative flippase GtrA
VFDWRSPAEWRQLWRYYQAGVVNTLFGFGLFALFVRLGLNIYVAQVASHVLGVIFNYVTYSRYAFAGQVGGRGRFVLSYAANYLASLGLLAVLTRVIASPYLAGLATTVVISLLNFFVLKKLVFARS